MYLPGTCTRRVGIYFRAGLAMFVRMITASRFLFGSDRNKPQIKGVAQKPPRRFFRKIRVPQKTPELGFFSEPLFRRNEIQTELSLSNAWKVFLREIIFFRNRVSPPTNLAVPQKNPLNKGSAKKKTDDLGFFCGTPFITPQVLLLSRSRVNCVHEQGEMCDYSMRSRKIRACKSGVGKVRYSRVALLYFLAHTIFLKISRVLGVKKLRKKGKVRERHSTSTPV